VTQNVIVPCLGSSGVLKEIKALEGDFVKFSAVVVFIEKAG
jgi:hypothetical protein